MRSRFIAVAAALALLLSAGAASANGDGGKPEGDTLFNYGYDPQAQLFLYNIHVTDTALYNCTLANGTLTATYGAPANGVIPVENLVDKETGKVVSFDPSELELADGLVAPGESVYPGGDCAISAVSIGAKGHINHGQFIKLFNEIAGMQGRGCFNRWLAQSELGKNEQHIRNKDVVAVTGIVKTGDIDFATAIATCDHGKKEKPEDHPGQGHAKDKNKDGDASFATGRGRPVSPGKSEKAPGHNKKP